MHIQSVWREVQAGTDQPTGPLWAKCHCGWEGYGRSYDDIEQLCAEHVEDAQRAEELEREEEQHA